MSDDAGDDLAPIHAPGSLLERAIDIGFGHFLERIVSPFPELFDPEQTPAEFLPYLAADRGVDEWDPDASEAEKRLTVALAWPTKRQAGTRAALENAIKGLQLVPDVKAWHEQTPKGAPYSFTVRAFANAPYSQEINARLDQRLAAAKSERDTLTVSIGLTATGPLYIAAGAIFSELATIQPFVLAGLSAAGVPYLAAATFTLEITTIKPMES